jgi:serine/threonine protein kinase, bacterial
LTQKLLRSGVMSESTVKSLLVELLPVFEYVHDRRIVHRDVKPDNIILRASDHRPILIDFGAVREAMGTVVNSQGNPTSSIVIGTPGFMPSEQAAGRPIFASDLYALGLTAIYLLTGKIPQELPTDPQTGEILWRQSAPNVSPTFASVLDRAVMSHPRDRFSNAREMLAALQGRIGSTVASPAVNMPQTIPVSNSSNFPTSPTVVSTSSTKPILLAGAIAGGLIGLFTVVGLALTRTSEKATTETTPISTSTPRSETSNPVQQESLPPTPTPQATAVENVNPANIPVQSNQGVGWIRIGAVPNSSTTIQDGIPLISTNQPVTIQPPIVPQNNSQVTILTGVNVRKGVPEPPTYDLTEQISVLPPGTKVIVLQKKSFVVPSNPSAVAVWAEIRIP